MFDVDGDGFITRDDLTRLLDLMVGRAMTPEAVEQVLRQTIAETDADGDGRISFDDFEQRASLSSSQWRHFTVPIKASMRWELQESLSQSASFNALVDEHG